MMVPTMSLSCQYRVFQVTLRKSLICSQQFLHLREQFRRQSLTRAPTSTQQMQGSLSSRNQSSEKKSQHSNILPHSLVRSPRNTTIEALHVLVASHMK